MHWGLRPGLIAPESPGEAGVEIELEPSFSTRKRPRGKRCFECCIGERQRHYISCSTALDSWPSAHCPSLISCLPTGARATPLESREGSARPRSPVLTLPDLFKMPSSTAVAGVSLSSSCFLCFSPLSRCPLPRPPAPCCPQLPSLKKEDCHVFFFFWHLLRPVLH